MTIGERRSFFFFLPFSFIGTDSSASGGITQHRPGRSLLMVLKTYLEEGKSKVVFFRLICVLAASAILARVLNQGQSKHLTHLNNSVICIILYALMMLIR